MDPYELTVEGARLLVRPQNDGTYLIYRANFKIGRLYPDVTESGVVWETADGIDDNYAVSIGKAIEGYEQIDHGFFKN